MENDKLTELRSNIVNNLDKLLFDDLIGCVTAQLYRPAYIMCWICIVESLKRKLYLLSEINDKKAQNAIKEIESAEKNHNSTDVLICKYSIECQLVDGIDKAKLDFFWQQRCIFTHPYTSYPTVDEVDFIIKEACRLVLTKDIYWNKGLIDNFIESITTAPFLLSNSQTEIEASFSDILKRVPRNLHYYFFKKLVYCFSVAYGNRDFQYAFKIRTILIFLLNNTPNSLSDNNWGFIDRLKDYPYNLIVGIISPDIWVKLPEEIKSIIFRYIETLDLNDCLHLKQIIGFLITSNALTEHEKLIYYNRLLLADFSNAIEHTGDLQKSYELLMHKLSFKKYTVQNEVAIFLKGSNGLSLLNQFSDEQKVQIGKTIAQLVNNGNYRLRELISQIATATIAVAESLIFGIASNILLNGRGEIERVHISLLNDFVCSMSLLSETQRNTIFETIVSKVETNTTSINVKIFRKDLISDITNLGYTDEIKNTISETLLKILNEIPEVSYPELPFS